LQSRFSLQLRLPGRVVPIGSGGAFEGGRITRGSGSPGSRLGVAYGCRIGPPQAASAISRQAKRMTERYQIAGFAPADRATIDTGIHNP
jgi:hypothetical protein